MPPKSTQKSPMRIIKKPAPSPATKKPTTRSATAKSAAPQPQRAPGKSKTKSKPTPFTAKVCIPHLQFHGDYVIFIVFFDKPPADVLLALKQHGGKYRRAPPNIDATMGWHLKATNGTVEFYNVMKKAYPDFAKQIAACINTIAKKPQSIECPSKPAASQAANRITGVVKVR